MAIYLPPTPGPLEGIGDTLLQAFLSKQKIDLQKDELKIRQQEFKLQQEEAAARAEQQRAAQQQQAFQNAQVQGPQMAAEGALMAALAQSMPLAVPGIGGPPMSIAPQPASPEVQQFGALRQGLESGTMTREQYLAALPGLQKKQEALTALQKSIDLARPLMSAEHLASAQAAMQAARAGMPDNIVQSLLPKAQVELALLDKELEEAKSKEEADKLATPWAIANGYGTPGSSVVLGASDLRKEARKSEIAFARQRSLELEKIHLQNIDKVLEGDAMSAALRAGTTDPKAIEAELKKMYPGLSAGQITQAAVAGSTAIRKMNAPATETQGKYRLVYAPAKAAQQTVKEMYAKGVVWTKDMDAAVSDWGYVGKAGAGDFLRRSAKGRLSEDQSALVSAVILLTEARLRPTSGAQLSEKEIFLTRDAFVPQENFAPSGAVAADAGEYKIARLDEYMASLAQNAGIEEDENNPALGAARVILNNRRAPAPVAPPQKPRTGGRR